MRVINLKKIIDDFVNRKEKNNSPHEWSLGDKPNNPLQKL